MLCRKLSLRGVPPNPQLRKEELQKVRVREAAAVDADEADLAREFSIFGTGLERACVR